MGVGLAFIQTLDKRVKLEVVLGLFSLHVGLCSHTQQHFGLVPGGWGGVEASTSGGGEGSQILEISPLPFADGAPSSAMSRFHERSCSSVERLWEEPLCFLMSEWEASHC